ncbi:MAG: 2OG-Fe(II) oxygenase family protein [Acidobacteriota bacterium]
MTLEPFANTGSFLATHPLVSPDRCAAAIEDARAFFALPEAAKRALAIEASPHFRGYSVMHNERDWREQIHFGREEALPAAEPAYDTLRGPNLWPDDPAWRSRMLALVADLERAARDILVAITGDPALLPEAEEPYLLLKLINYQQTPHARPRSGVAPHVDFSWITLLLQDTAGGLEVRTPDGQWIAVPATPGIIPVNVGEILEFATRGRLAATAHRVISRGGSRLSMPFFLNPSLDRHVEPQPVTPAFLRESDADEHVHRVFSQPRLDPFVFGEQEWRRKGLGVYCGDCIQAPY